jgi:hypothetical protein
MSDLRYEYPEYDANPGKCNTPPGGCVYADLNGSGTTIDGSFHPPPENGGGTKRTFMVKYQYGAYDADMRGDAPPYIDDRDNR